MRRTLNAGLVAGTLGLGVIMAAGVTVAASSTQQHASAAPGVTTAAVTKLVTRSQARRIAEAKVPHSRAIEVQSDDLHDRAVWKVTLTTSHGRVLVDVDKRTGRATVLGRGSGGHDDAVLATSLAASRSTAAADDHGRDDHGRDGDGHHKGRDGHDKDRHDRGDR